MNPLRPLLAPIRLLYAAGLKSRWLLPCQQCHTFGPSDDLGREAIETIYVINLDRQQDRWAQVSREFNLVLDSSRVLLAKRVIRHSAIDARSLEQSLPASGDIEPFYTLRDQLFVEPQPRAFPDRLELDEAWS